MSHNNEQITALLIDTYPYLSNSFKILGPILWVPSTTIPIPEAVCKIVIGQMLSRQAASTIYKRARKCSENAGLNGCWQLSDSDLLACGLSKRKAQTISQFRTAYEQDPNKVEQWRHLEYQDLMESVNSHWGLSNWSADMLAIFYLGLPDVFPLGDGTIKRATRFIENNLSKGETFSPESSSPYRTFLALHLWRCIDEQIFQ